MTTGTTTRAPVRALAAGAFAATTMAATYNVHSYYDSTYAFAGISIVTTRVWGDYVTGSGKVLSITDYGCQIVRNYDVWASVTTDKQSGNLDGGTATFKCYVVISRGLQAPWQITWSTRSAYQYMTVNGPGIVSKGWM